MKTSLHWGVADTTNIPSVAQDVTDLVIQPNPVGDVTTLSLNLAQGADLRVRIIDLGGRLLKDIEMQALSWMAAKLVDHRLLAKMRPWLSQCRPCAQNRLL